jgi:branched-chain amino acid transport system permease protein
MVAIQQTLYKQLAAIPLQIGGLVVVVALVSLRFMLSEFQLTIASEMIIVGLFALSLNLIMGYGGMVHFGHAAFYGVGGYTVAVLITHFGWSPWLAMMAAPFVSAVFALVIGWFSVRRVGLYFSILTLAFGQLVYTLVFNAREITGGDDGLHGLKFPEIINTPGNYYLFTVLVFVACYLVIRMLVKSPFILILQTIRENAERAQFIGIDVRRHQLITFVIGGFFAGIAGALLAGKQHFVGVEMLFWTTSAEPILASLLGGMYVLSGPVVGAALLVFLNLILNRIFAYWPLALGTLTVVIVLIAPTGLLGLAQRLLRRGERSDKA